MAKEKETKTEERGLQRRSDRMNQWMSPFEEMSRMFDNFFSRGWMSPLRRDSGWSVPMPFEGKAPRVDMIDQDDALLVRAELPGVSKKDINIKVNDHSLMISGETRVEKEETKEGNFYHRERSYGSFSRTLPLPVEVNAETVKATFKDGLLEIRLPKVQATQSRQVSIE